FASAAVFGDEVWIWGGTFRTNETPETALADGGRYFLGTDVWRPMNLYDAAAARARTAAVVYGGEMIVWGGDPNGSALATGARYVPSSVCGVGPCLRSGAAVCAGGSVAFQCTPGPPQPEVCDG